ncbi:MAG TPA: MoaD/ThiS family protein [Anaerolineaceae bacterium]|nr:MoaD/ThiS family protein [Anaerolineaceae bacterium]
MITVKVSYYNILATCVGVKHESVLLPENITILTLIQGLAERLPGTFQEIALVNEAPSPHLRVFHNRRLVKPEDFELSLADGDEIMMFPAIAGG